MPEQESNASDSAYLNLVLDNAPVVIFATDLQGVLTLSQGQGLAALGLRPGQSVGRSLFALYGHEPGLSANLQRALTGEAFQATQQLGERFYVTHYRPLRGEDGALMGMTGVSVDLTDQIQAQRQAEALLRLSELMEVHPSGDSAVQDGAVQDSAVQSLTSVLEVLSSTMPLDALVLWTPEDARYVPLAVYGTVNAAARTLLKRGVPTAYFRTLGVLDGQRVYWEAADLPPEVARLELTGMALLPLHMPGQGAPLLLGAYRRGVVRRWAQGERQLLAAAARSMAVNHRRQLHFESLHDAAHRDALTQLGNRRAFGHDLALATQQAHRTGQTLGVLSIDIDGLKQVNDQEGHARGDALLHQFAQSLVEALRGSDQVYRLGGDEFAVILPGLRTEQVAAIEGRLMVATERVQAAGFPLASASGGVAIFPADTPDADTLIRLADQRMYRMKQGRAQARQVPAAQRVLVVEDQPGMARLIEVTLKRAGYQVEVCHRAQTARALLLEDSIDLLVTDLALPDGPQAGLDLLRELRSRGVAVPVLFLSANLDPRMRVLGLQAGGDDFLVKPFERAELVARVEALLRRRGPGRAVRS